MKEINIDSQALEEMSHFKIGQEIGFGQYMCPIMIRCDYANGRWGEIRLMPYGPISLDPCTKVLHYGQEIFEGMKAYRNEKNQVMLFRPDQNAKRFNRSAFRMAMPEFPEEDFINAAKTLTDIARNHIPNQLGESLYIRPFMFATEIGLGIKPANAFCFMMVCSPSRSYFSNDSIKVWIERSATRAAPGGTGGAKAGGNYAASLQAATDTIKRGCQQTLWLDAIHKRYIEEMSGMNFFAWIKGELYTPEITDTILRGITRDSLIYLAKEEGINTHEARMDIDELLSMVKTGECDEAFVCGTASVLVPIESFHEEVLVCQLRNTQAEKSLKLKNKMLMIQSGREQAPDGWCLHV